MRILILEWDSFGHEYMMDAYERAGCRVECFPWPFGTESMRENPKLEQSLMDHLRNKNYHFVFSFNFFPVAAKVCDQLGTMYVSWIYDSPFMLLYSRYADCPTSQIYIFDRSICQQCWDRGMKNVYYMPMAAPVSYYDRLKHRRKYDKRYDGEVSFVGSTYRDSGNDFRSLLNQLDDHTSGYLDALVYAQKEISGGNILEDLLTEEILTRLKSVCPVEKGEDEWESDAWIYANYFLARRVTGLQRTEVLQNLSEICGVNLYTTEPTRDLLHVKNCGSVDYLTEMPLVFMDSKVNLNITLKSIYTGIPLRAIEVMGCGGFLISDCQTDFFEDFIPNEDFVYYTDMDDLSAKVMYYLEHEEERKRIAENGYQKVKKYHTYDRRVETILSCVMKEKERELNDLIIALEEVRCKQGGCWYEMKIDWEHMDDNMLCQTVDTQAEWMENEKQLLFRCRDVILELTDRSLSEGTEEALEKLLKYFSKNIIKTLFVPFSEIMCIYIFIRLYQIEKQQGMHYTIQKYDNHKQLIEIYRRLICYLRRIDTELPQEKKCELFEFMHREELSPTAVYMILHSNDCLNAEQIWNKLQSLGEEESYG